MKRKILVLTLITMLAALLSITASAANCKICFGRGRTDCMICHGSGTATSFSIAPSSMNEFADCQGCSGRGWNLCIVCDGSGEVPDNNNTGNARINNDASAGTNNIADFDIDVSNNRLRKYRGSGSNVVIPDSVEIIGMEVFLSGSLYVTDPAFYLTDLYIPSSVTAIRTQAFRGCAKLRNVTIEPGVKEIYGGAFQGCESLESIVIPPTVTYMGAGVFDNCKNLKSVYIPPGVTNLSYYNVDTSTPTPTQGSMFNNCHNSLTIYGEPGSTIEKYAKFHGVNFMPYYFDLYEADAVKTLENAIQKAGLPLIGKPNVTINQKTVTVAFPNAGKITKNVIDALNNTAEKAKVNLKLVVDTKDTVGKIFSRVTINPALVKGDINLMVYDADTAATDVKSIINTYYSNKIIVVNMDKNINAAQSMGLVIKNKVKLKTNLLKFYSYDFDTNTTTPINTKYTVDKNGFIHFKSDSGGIIIISDDTLRDK